MTLGFGNDSIDQAKCFFSVRIMILVKSTSKSVIPLKKNLGICVFHAQEKSSLTHIAKEVSY